MTSAALIVVVVAGSFAFADVVLIKAVGLGVAIAVAIDATIVRALLVPATMRLLGVWNWWMPERLRRWLAERVPRPVGGRDGGRRRRPASPADGRPGRGLAVVLAVLVAGCAGGPILANQPASLRPEPAAAPSPALAVDPVPIRCPATMAPTSV